MFDLALLENKELILIEINPLETSGRGLFGGKEGEKSICDKGDLVIKCRRDLEIPYKEHWEDNLQYMMKDLCEHKPYYEFLNQK